MTDQDTPTEVRPCPACPDGSVWTSEGPTSKICPICKGHALVNMDGSPFKRRGYLTECDMDEDESL